jgi:membrane protease subunit HflC
VVGRRTLAEILTTARPEIMKSITRQSDGELRSAGITIDDVRINRTELPPGTEKNVYERMRTERQRLARKLRAEGDEEGRRIRAQADGQARVIVADATRDAEIVRGQGDAEAARIYGEAYSSDPEFYGFVRSLEAYKKTLGPGTTLVLPPSAEFFRLLESAGPPRR